MESFEIAEDGVILNQHPSRTFPLWRFLVMLLLVFFVMLFSSFLVCLVNDQCRNSVPTAHVLLTSPLTAPYMVIALYSGLSIYFITCLGIYVKSERRLVVLGGVAVYGSVGAILVVFPFTGWDRNWAILLFIGCFFVWMIIVTFTFRREYQDNLTKLQTVIIIGYALCGLAWTVLNFIPGKNVDIGQLIVEIVGVTMILSFMAICLSFVWRIQIKVKPHL